MNEVFVLFMVKVDSVFLHFFVVCALLFIKLVKNVMNISEPVLFVSSQRCLTWMRRASGQFTTQLRGISRRMSFYQAVGRPV